MLISGYCGQKHIRVILSVIIHNVLLIRIVTGVRVRGDLERLKVIRK